jgi:DNA-binding IclR family transcriptional regulator
VDAAAVTDSLAAGEAGGTSFGRGLTVLLTVAEHGLVRADAIADLLGMPVSSVYRFLRTLKDFGLVVESDGGYGLGPRLSAIAGQGPSHAQLATLGLPVLEELQRRTGETADLLVRSGRHALCVQQMQSNHTIRVAFRIGGLLPLYAGAEQRVLLAFAPPHVIDEVISEDPKRFTSGTLSAAELLSSLEQIRLRRLAVSHGEYIAGTTAVAVPVFAGNRVVCSLGVAGPRDRCTEAWEGRAARALADAARLLSGAVTD